MTGSVEKLNICMLQELKMLEVEKYKNQIRVIIWKKVIISKEYDDSSMRWIIALPDLSESSKLPGFAKGDPKSQKTFEA